MDLSVVIVNHNTRERLGTCLRSLIPEITGIEAEIFVVDNGSTDASAEMVCQRFPRVSLLIEPTNTGFARANNRALRRAAGRHVLILNPDTEIQPGAVRTLRQSLDSLTQAVAVGPKVVRPDGRLDLACRRTFPSPLIAFARLAGLSRILPRSRWLARYNRTYEDPDVPGEMDAGTAAALCFHREALARINYFDEDFFMYGEDLDLCYRLKKDGGRIYYVPSAVVLHVKGESSKQQPRAMLREFHRAMWLFYRKHYARGWTATLAPLVWLGIQLHHGAVLGWNALRGRQVVSP